MKRFFRNAFSTHAKSRKAAGPMKDRRIPRGGASNEQRELHELAAETAGLDEEITYEANLYGEE